VFFIYLFAEEQGGVWRQPTVAHVFGVKNINRPLISVSL
jgi:hypothetical protein